MINKKLPSSLYDKTFIDAGLAVHEATITAEKSQRPVHIHVVPKQKLFILSFDVKDRESVLETVYPINKFYYPGHFHRNIQL